MSVSVLIVDDHPLFRKGLRAIINSNSNYNITGEATNGAEAIELVKELEPDVIVMDITMPTINGIEATKEILTIFPDTKILALSIHTGKQFVKGMLNAGAVGYLIKDSAPEELLIAIGKIVNNEMYLCSAITSVALSLEEAVEKEAFLILNTKLHRPTLADDYVQRKEILEYLESNSDKPLSLISAPAGYGKSIVASQWLEYTKSLHTWVSIDEEHSNLKVFLIYIHAAIEKLFPGTLDKTGIILSANELPPVNIIAHNFINEIDLINQDFILVLDDYNQIKDSQVHDFIDEILRFPPEHLHLLIITRKDPPLNLSSLKINGRINEIRMNNLCFSENEIKILYKKLINIQISDESIQQLLKKTEGWIVGLRLASIQISDVRNSDELFRNGKGDDQLVSDFLISEVLSERTESFKKQLIVSSILNRFNANLLDSLFDKEYFENPISGNAFIKQLITSNLFVISLENDHTWFRYHALFQGILRKQLVEMYAVEQVSAMHERISCWFQKNDIIGEAIEHALKANSNNKAIEIIEKEWVAATNEFNWKIVEGWLTYMPDAVINASVKLLLIKAWIVQSKNKIQKLSKIVHRIDQLEQDLSPTDTGFLLFYKGILNCNEGLSEAALTFFNEAIALIPESYILIRSDIYFYEKLVQQMSGQKEVSILNETEIANLTNLDNDSIMYGRKLLQEISIGMLDTSLTKTQHKIKAYFNQKRANSSSISMASYFKGSCNYWANELVVAVTEFENHINNKYRSNYRSIIDSFIGQALSYHYLNKPQESLDSIKKMMLFAEEIDDFEIMKFAKSGETRISLLQGNITIVKKWMNTVTLQDLKANTLYWIDEPVITYCRVLLVKNTEESLPKALELLSNYLSFSKSIHNKLRIIEVLVLKSMTNTKLENKRRALSNLNEAINIAASGGFVQPFVAVGNEILELLLELKSKKQNLNFIDTIIGLIEQRNLNFKSSGSKKQSSHKLFRKIISDDIISTREVEVVNLVAEGLRNKEIAEKLFVSDDTIKKHLYHIFQKMEVSNRTGLVTKAKELGIISK